MRWICYHFFFLISFTAFQNSLYCQNKESISEDIILMGSAFKFTAISEDLKLAEKSIQEAIKEVERIESLISSWNHLSETSKINSQAGIRPTTVSKELFDLIYRSKKVSQLTSGAFDISFAGINHIWDFSQKQIDKLPSQEELKSSVAKINFENIILNQKNQSVFLKEKGMKIGFGAIGKGYAANKAKIIMQDLGIESGVVNAGGDLISWGHKADGSDWKIAVPNPQKKEKIISWLNMSNMAVVTSGNYERYVEIDGERYCHIIDPHTGWPTKGISSVTVIAPDAEIADALATAVFILGRKEGLKLINHLDQIECFLVTDNLELFHTNGIDFNYIMEE